MIRIQIDLFKKEEPEKPTFQWKDVKIGDLIVYRRKDNKKIEVMTVEKPVINPDFFDLIYNHGQE